MTEGNTAATSGSLLIIQRRKRQSKASGCCTLAVPELRKLKQKNHWFKAIFSHVESLRPIRSLGDSVSNPLPNKTKHTKINNRNNKSQRMLFFFF